MWVDTGTGFERPVHKDLMINRNGLSYGHFSSEGRGIRAIRFDPCSYPALVRLDWIEMSLKVVGSAEITPVRLSIRSRFRWAHLCPLPMALRRRDLQQWESP